MNPKVSDRKHATIIGAIQKREEGLLSFLGGFISLSLMLFAVFLLLFDSHRRRLRARNLHRTPFIRARFPDGFIAARRHRYRVHGLSLVLASLRVLAHPSGLPHLPGFCVRHLGNRASFDDAAGWPRSGYPRLLFGAALVGAPSNQQGESP